MALSTTYRFENGSGGHPIRIQSTSGASGTAYNTGVTNNAGSGTVIVEVQHDAPDVLYYQCTSHAAMNGILYITGALADGGVTTAKLADQAVTLAKLPHGTSSNDGKFLRANNGADPSFETVTTTTINSNADNRIITGSGTADTLNAESGLTFDGANQLRMTGSGQQDLIIGSTNANGASISLDGDSNGDASGADYALIRHNTDGNLEITTRNPSGAGTTIFTQGTTESMRINSSGRLVIGSTTEGHSNADDLTVASSADTGITIRSGTSSQSSLYFSDATSGTGEYAGSIAYNHSNDKLFLATNTTNRIAIDSSGNVGIGDTSPDSLLHIGKGTNADDGAVTITIGGSSVNARQSSIIKNNAGGSNRALEIHATTASNNHETIKFFTDADTERMRIDSSGKVGIGKDNPSFLLEVKGSTQDTIRLNHSGETSSGSHNVKIVAGGAHYQNIHFEGSSIFYKTWNGSSVGERFRIRSTGGVTFNGDTADSNALDDYEEGSWTPQMYDANGSNVVLSVTSGSCFYTKVGRIVNASGIITRNETGSKSGMLTISHLPYTSYVGHSQLCAGSWWMDRGFGNDTVGGVCYIPGNSSQIHLTNPTAVHTTNTGNDKFRSSTRYLEFSQWENAKHIYFNVTYQTS